MPRGGPRPNSGGKRNGAGRKKGSTAQRTAQANELAAVAAGDGAMPLEIMLTEMRTCWKEGKRDRAVQIAEKAAPYLHSRLSSVQHGGEVSTVVVIEDERWYANTAHHLLAEGAAPPVAGAIGPGPVQGGGVRPAVG